MRMEETDRAALSGGPGARHEHAPPSWVQRLACGLQVVAWLGHRLPVPLVPEQITIASMRDAMVHHSGELPASTDAPRVLG